MRLSALAFSTWTVFAATTSGTGPRKTEAPVTGRRIVSTPVGCRSANAFANEFRDFAVSVLTGTDSSSMAERQAWDIPAVADTAIVFETDSATCNRAAQAHAAKIGADTANPPPVFLLRAGPTRYVAFNGFNVSDSFLYFVFDSTFQYLGTIGS